MKAGADEFGNAGRAGQAAGPFGVRFVAPLALGSLLNPVNSSMISTALVPIAADFQATVAETAWLIAGLYLASAVAQPTMGRLADLFGPRRVFLAALCLVAVAGFIGATAPTLGVLIASRVLLGIGTSGAYPAAMRIFRTRADRLGAPPPRAAMGVLSMAALSTAAVGPLFGGVLTTYLGWHAIFSVNIPLAVAAIVLILLWTPPDAPGAGGFTRLFAEFDMIGAALFAAFLLSAMLFLMNLAKPLWPALPLAAVFGVALVVWSLRRRQPFIDVRMLAANRPLALTYLRNGAILLVGYCVFYGLAQWLESSAGMSAVEAGLVTMPMSLVAAAGSFAGARTRSIRTPFVLATGSAVLGCAGLLLLHHDSALVWIVASVALFGLPMGMTSVATQAAVYIQAPAAEIGSASGLQRTAAYLGAIGSASLLSLMYGHHATDDGLHGLALVMGVVSALILVAVLFDPTLPGAAPASSPAISHGD